MKKMLLLLAVLCLSLSACMPALLQTPAAASPAPISEVNIEATVAMRVQQTLQSLPTPTFAPSNTPVVMTATSVPTQTQPMPTPTETQNPILLTLTATLGTGTVTLVAGTVGTLPFTSTPNPAISVTPTETNHYQYYGTMPPNLPSGTVWLRNISKAESYISLTCTTTDGYVTIIEYPVANRGTVKAVTPAGKYTYVASVGGKTMTGNFRLGKLQEVTITMDKDRVTVK